MPTTDNETRALTLEGVRGGLAGPRFALVVYHRDGTEVAPLLPGERVVVGRVPPASLVVGDSSLSRQHARFSLLGDEVMVEDLESTNGTWVAGESITSAVLRPGDVAVLGAVTCAIQAVGGSPRIGLDAHDRFEAALEREVLRARHFGRPLAVVMFRVCGPAKLHEWAPVIASGLRSIDNVALYGGDTLEVLLPEMGASEALGVAQRLAQANEVLLLSYGVCAYPDAATTTETLIASCRDALQRTTGARRAAVAPSAMVTGTTTEDASPFVAKSAVMQELLNIARRVARGAIPVLVAGETGTGKEVLARFLHSEGPRDGPLVAVNCASIPSSLVESTLFGHVKGAFTGANQAHAGVFEAADGGTVLLDEIGELPAAAQAALLRVLESRVVTRVGATAETPVDVRVLAASHRDLEAMVADGGFREDLLYRLNAVTLEIPALRQRRADILALAEHFLVQANARNRTSVGAIAEDAKAALERYSWPGNVRELRNALERAVVIAEQDVVRLIDLPRRIQQAESVAPAPTAPPARAGASARRPNESFRDCIERIEAEMIRDALEASGGNQSEAARSLDMPRRTLVHKIKVLGLRDR
jgi:two-component system, NtrC family, response regulator AtoC